MRLPSYKKWSVGILARSVAIALLGTAAAGTVSAADSDHSFEIYGFAQADYIQDLTAGGSGLGRCLPPLEDRHRRQFRHQRASQHQRQAEPLRREGLDADRRQHADHVQI